MGSIYHEIPPEFQSRDEVNPTLLVSWWCTIFALTTILIRIFGRWVRTERLFREDKIILWSIIPLLIRMGLVHVVLIYGTNNTDTTGLSSTQIMHREIGSKLVLAARILYAAFIWIAKLTVLEFLKRTIGAAWARSYELGLRFIYGFLVLTFLSIVIATLAECQPFPHYFQVVPDPGPHCREGLVQLIVMGVCDIVTDIVLIAFPIPVVIRSSMPATKKISLIALFLLSAILIGVTAYRIPSTIDRRADQPYRSLLASLEILAAAFVANMVIIGSFIRDKGVKKAKFRRSLSAASDPEKPIQRTRTKSVTFNHWGSDEDLVRGMGLALPVLLRSGTHTEVPRPPGAAPPGAPDDIQEEPREEKQTEGAANKSRRRSEKIDSKWGFSQSRRRRRKSSDSSGSSISTDNKLRDLRDVLNEPVSPGHEVEPEPAPLGKQMSFFDVGGLVDKPNASTPSGNSREASVKGVAASSAQAQGQGQPGAVLRGRSSSKAFLSDIGGSLWKHKEEDHDDGSHLAVSQRQSQSHSQRGSHSHVAVGTATSRSLTPSHRARRDGSSADRPDRGRVACWIR